MNAEYNRMELYFIIKFIETEWKQKLNERKRKFDLVIVIFLIIILKNNQIKCTIFQLKRDRIDFRH